jgi:hypothetical protein
MLFGQKDRGAAKKTIVGYQSFLRLLAEGLPPKNQCSRDYRQRGP